MSTNKDRRRVMNSIKKMGGEPDDIYVLSSHRYGGGSISSYYVLDLYKLNDSSLTIDLVKSFTEFEINVTYYNNSIIPIDLFYSYSSDKLVIIYSEYYYNSSSYKYYKIIYDLKTNQIISREVEDENGELMMNPLCVLPDGSHLYHRNRYWYEEVILRVTSDWQTYTDINLTYNQIKSKLSSLTNGYVQTGDIYRAIYKDGYIYFLTLYSSIYACLWKLPESSLTTSNVVDYIQLVGNYVQATNYNSSSNLSVRGNNINVIVKYPEKDRGYFISWDTVNNTVSKSSSYNSATTYNMYTVGDEVDDIIGLTTDYSTNVGDFALVGYKDLNSTSYMLASELSYGISFAHVDDVLIYDKIYGRSDKRATGDIVSIDLTKINWTSTNSSDSYIPKTAEKLYTGGENYFSNSANGIAICGV